MAVRKLATWAAVLAPLGGAASLPVVIHNGTPVAHADDLSNDGTTPPAAQPPEPGPGSFDDLSDENAPPADGSGGSFDDLSNDGTTPPPPQPPEPGPGSFDDLSNDGTTPPPPQPPEPGPGVPDDLTDENAPPSAPPPAPVTPPPPVTPPAGTATPPAAPGSAGTTAPPAGSGTRAPGHPAPFAVRHGRTSITLRTASRLSRKRLRKGVTIRLSANSPAGVLVTLRGPGRRRVQRTLVLGAGTRSLTLKPSLSHYNSRGRKVTVTVLGAGGDGTRISLHRNIALR